MLRFTVRFDRQTRDNDDYVYANKTFSYIADPARRLLEQMRSELGLNSEFAGLWDTYFSRIITDNLFCVWVGFDWPGSGVEFVRTLQETYDVHGMSGSYEILDVAGLSVHRNYNREFLLGWVAEANKAPAIAF